MREIGTPMPTATMLSPQDFERRNAALATPVAPSLLELIVLHFAHPDATQRPSTGLSACTAEPACRPPRRHAPPRCGIASPGSTPFSVDICASFFLPIPCPYLPAHHTDAVGSKAGSSSRACSSSGPTRRSYSACRDAVHDTFIGRCMAPLSVGAAAISAATSSLSLPPPSSPLAPASMPVARCLSQS
ncbi:hypothetical protein DFH08DRAFT_993973 [Mycena albidolilacea]|uniref:Uncharacterized protein n=1 Tax=Mycena albidolilacea TaxID=1033008 RepID=A0AAD6YYI9_9AGAR|nr:hypothetical protein DFH08DRAFT_993973 [Mycena albidolilacea]